MKLNTKKQLYALALAAVAGALPGLAAAVPIIVGIDIGPGPFRFVSSTIMERQQGTLSSPITAAGQLLEGVGQVTQIFSGATLVWSSGQNGRELTFRFYDYLATLVTTTHDTFTGGKVDFFSDTALNANFGSTGVASFIDGTPWLSLKGVEFDPGTSPGGNRTLDSTGTLLGTSISGTGIGLVEVTGGPAGAVFNTNSHIAAGTGNLADFELNSSFNNSPSPFGFGTHGVASLSQNAVPEPAPLALLSLGLFGIGMMSRFKKRS